MISNGALTASNVYHNPKHKHKNNQLLSSNHHCTFS